MTKKAVIVDRANISRLGGWAQGLSIVLDMGAASFDPLLVDDLGRAGHDVVMLLVAPETLADIGTLGYPAATARTLCRPSTPPTIRDALAYSRVLARSEIAVALRLESAADLDILRTMSSLGIMTRLDFDVLTAPGEPLLEALLDVVLMPGPRARITPISELVEGFDDPEFALGSLDLRSPDYFVDLRNLPRPVDELQLSVPNLEQQRVERLLAQSPCAFCEGLMLCYGHLKGRDDSSGCRQVFAEFAELFATRIARARKKEPSKVRLANHHRESY
jgi:hypothetical protein